MFRSDEDRESWPVKRLAVLLLAALALRVGIGLWLPTTPAFLGQLPDQLEYLELGRSLLDGRGLVLVDSRYAVDQTLRAYRMPGYPLFVAALGANVTAVRMAQAVIDTATVLAIFLLARRWLRNGGSLIAGLFVAFNPYLAYFSALVLTETVFIALLAWGMVGIARTRSSRRGAKWWWIGMACLVLSVYFRPSGAGLAIVLGLVSVFLSGRHPFAVHSRWPVPVGMTTILMLFLALLPWAVRNWLVLGEPVWLTTNSGITLYDGWQIDNTTGGSDQSFIQRMPQLTLMNEVERSAYLREKAIETIQTRPIRAVELAVKKAARTWSPIPLSQSDQASYVLAGLVYSIPLFVLALAGLLGTRLPWPAKALLIAPAVYLTVIHMLTVGSLRYRIPADVPMSVLAGAGAAALVVGLRQHRTARQVEEEMPNETPTSDEGVKG